MKDKILITLLCAGFLAVAAALLLIQPYMEARTYNKFSDGPKATVVDAIFGQLRITD